MPERFVGVSARASLSLALVGLAAAVGGGFLFAQGVQGLGNTQRLVMPGTAEVRLIEPGTHMILYEYRSVVDGTHYDTQRPVNLRVTVIEAAQGQALPLTPWSNTRYAIGDYAGSSLVTFRAERAGRYEVRASYAPAEAGPPFVLAIADVGAALRTVFGGVLGLVGLTLAGTRAALLFIGRRRADHRPPSVT